MRAGVVQLLRGKVGGSGLKILKYVFEITGDPKGGPTF